METKELHTIPAHLDNKQRRLALMKARDAAVAKGDWAAMNDITKRLAKLPLPTVGK